MLTIIATWLKAKFALFKVALITAGVVSVFSVIVGAYVKGRIDCRMAHALASANAVIESQTKQLDDIMIIARESAQATGDFIETEAFNDGVETEINLRDVTANSGCVDGEWLRGLSKLR